MAEYDLDFARAFPGPVCAARIREAPEHFRVVEELAITPEGRGEHLYLKITKRARNTRWVADRLAHALSIRARDVGYAGLKDRYAVATQWFSCWLPGRADPPLEALHADGVEILEARRHVRKLRRGELAGNRFELLLTGLPWREGVQRELETRLEQIAAGGIPNYFGEQRFGREGHNLVHAHRLLCGCEEVRVSHLRGLYLSSARAYLFNLLLQRRVADGTWDRRGEGHPASAPLYGLGARLDPAERAVLAPFERWCEGLERLGLKAEGRALRAEVGDLEWAFPADGQLQLRFFLGKGCYATALLRELVAVNEPVES